MKIPTPQTPRRMGHPQRSIFTNQFRLAAAVTTHPAAETASMETASSMESAESTTVESADASTMERSDVTAMKSGSIERVDCVAMEAMTDGQPP